MRKRSIKEELEKYPCYEFKDGKLVRIPPPIVWFGVHLHHYIRTQWQRNNPEKFKEVEHLQKLIFLPPQMHMELHARHRKFKEKYGIEIDELLFNWKGYDMISAAKAREKSAANSVVRKREDIEKLINRAIDKGLNTAFVSGQAPEVLVEEIKQAGYSVERESRGLRITW